MPYDNPEDAKAYNKAYYEKNKEKEKARVKAYSEKNKEKIKAYREAYYEKNKEKINAKHKAYREKNKEKTKVRNKTYRENNKERLLANYKTYYEKNKEKIKARHRTYYKKNKDRVRNKELKRNFGISLHEYNLMLTEQKGKCSCCGIHQNELTKKFAVDHDHDTGLIRGLLCNHCNLAIGMLGDNLEGLMKALNYLEKHELTKERKTNEHVVQVKPKPNVQVKVQRGHLQSQVPA